MKKSMSASTLEKVGLVGREIITWIRTHVTTSIVLILVMAFVFYPLVA